MKKFYMLASAMLLAASSFAAEGDNYWYIRGAFNGYNPDFSDQWALMDDDVGAEGFYSGYFTIPEGEFSFNLVDPEGLIYVPMDQDGYTTSVNLDFTDSHIYSGVCTQAFDDDYDYICYWKDESWPGGAITVQVTVEGQNPKIEIVAYPNSTLTNSNYQASYSDGVVTLAWEDVDGVYTLLNEGAYLLNEDGTKIALSNSKYNSGLYIYEGNIKISYSDPIGITVSLNNLEIPSGEYTLVIPEGYLEIDWDNYEIEGINPTIEYTFEYVAPTYPESIYVLGAFNDFEVSEDYVISNLDEDLPAQLGGILQIPEGEFNLYLTLGEDYYYALYDGEVSLDANIYYGSFTMTQDSEKGVHWTCENWPGGSVDFNINLAKQTVTLYLSPQYPDIINDDYTASYSGEIVTLAWNNAQMVVTKLYEGAYLKGSNENIPLTNYKYNSELEKYEGNIQNSYSNPVGVLVHLDNLELEDGTYTLVIPQGYLEISWGEDWEFEGVNPEIEYTFEYKAETGGISAIQSAAAEGNVFTLQGVKVKDANNLQNGIYIINGKKVMIRK